MSDKQNTSDDSNSSSDNEKSNNKSYSDNESDNESDNDSDNDVKIEEISNEDKEYNIIPLRILRECKTYYEQHKKIVILKKYIQNKEALIELKKFLNISK